MPNKYGKLHSAASDVSIVFAREVVHIDISTAVQFLDRLVSHGPQGFDGPLLLHAHADDHRRLEVSLFLAYESLFLRLVSKKTMHGFWR